MGVADLVSTVFVNNLPSRVYWRWVWLIFQYHEKILDVFIPKQMNVNGRRFGFVRFSGMEDTHRVVNVLNCAWLMDYRLNVNFARYNSRVVSWKKVDNEVRASENGKLDMVESKFDLVQERDRSTLQSSSQ
ncbi:hypothetical protein REPUB_Repub16aG0118500 [Reevesia pubescens]